MNNLQNPFALLQPKNLPARGEPSSLPLSELTALVLKHKQCEHILDLETRGTDPLASEAQVVGIGIASHWGTFYAETTDNRQWQAFLVATFEAQVPFLAHNVMFDASWMTSELGKALNREDGWQTSPDFHNWQMCTYAAYRWLACEGFLGQKYGLKQAMVELLGWPESNEAELDQWLIDNGYTMQHGGADKSQMWRAPSEILGKYCWYDAEATYLIWTEILKPVMDRFAAFQMGYSASFMSLIRHVVWQKLRGIYIDSEQLHNYSKDLTIDCQNLARNFLEADGVAEAVQQFNKSVVDEHKSVEPKQYKKMPELGTEPPRFKKDGKQSKTWEKWEEKRQQLENHVPEITIPWRKWHEKHTKMRKLAETTELSTEAKDLGLFNMDSSRHKQWLFYTGLGHEVISTTDSGEPAVDEDALLLLRPQGPKLIEYNEKNKLQSMVNGCLSKIETGFLHVGLKCPGTYTGRLGGANGLNVQNVPKDRGYLSCWKASPGCKLVIFDIASLEPHVLALASGDPTLMRLYGPQSSGWDCVYLSVGARLGGRVGDTIRAAGYDPIENTKESVSKAKKEAKDARQIAKVIHLAASYGASANKIRQTLSLQGIQISHTEAKEMFDRYWKLFAAVKEYEKFLLAQWERSGGWFINPIGRPMCVAQDYLKDIVNRAIQGAGHDCFVLFLHTVAETLKERKVNYAPYIWDIHDCVMLEVPEDQAEECKKLLDGEVLERLNYFLDGQVKLKGEANVVDNWAQDKFEG
jgi:DNA polymerase I-like protein with 3'-5' exonuclease and polymerase domains